MMQRDIIATLSSTFPALHTSYSLDLARSEQGTDGVAAIWPGTWREVADTLATRRKIYSDTWKVD